MKNSIFTLHPSLRSEEERNPGIPYPDLVEEALQVFECSLDSYEIDEKTHAQQSKATSLDSVIWAIPRVFLTAALCGIVEEAKRAGVAVITPEFLDTVRDRMEKGR